MRDILIVEDGLHERQRLETLFSDAGYSVSSAESVGEAEKLLTYEEYRLAFLDIGLGDKSGSYLFDMIRRTRRVSYVIILTGNPSVHLKQRFLDEGAIAYIVKASQEAGNDALLARVKGLLGTSQIDLATGIPLDDFLRIYLSASSRELFLDENGEVEPCQQCGSKEFVVSFAHKTQLPPNIEGRVICAQCNKEMDPEVG